MSYIPVPILQSGITPTGTINGLNKVFTLPRIPRAATTLVVRVAGIAIATTAMTVNGNSVTLAVAPLVGNLISVDYWY